jgi:hypothetical protein
MSTRSEVMALARKLGAHVEASHVEVRALAPIGWRWACGPIELVSAQWDETDTMSSMYGDIYGRMQMGLIRDEEE